MQRLAALLSDRVIIGQRMSLSLLVRSRCRTLLRFRYATISIALSTLADGKIRVS